MFRLYWLEELLVEMMPLHDDLQAEMVQLVLRFGMFPASQEGNWLCLKMSEVSDVG